MTEKIERLVKTVYRRWKKHSQPDEGHISEEDMACFLDGCASPEENERLKAHLVACDDCARLLVLGLNAEVEGLRELPEGLLDKAKEILNLKESLSPLKIFLRLKEHAFEVISATGDILLGQELIPAPVLRSRKIGDFKDEVTILKDFKDIRLEVRVESKAGKYFDVTLKARQKNSSRPLKDLRVTLIREGVELESYLSDSGVVSFEHVRLGKYCLEVNGIEGKLAGVVLDIKV